LYFLRSPYRSLSFSTSTALWWSDYMSVSRAVCFLREVLHLWISSILEHTNRLSVFKCLKRFLPRKYRIPFLI
jgi:hypothetical protein